MMTRKQAYLLGYGDGRRYARDFQEKHGRRPMLDEFHQRCDRHIGHRGLEEEVGRFSYRYGYDDGCTEAEGPPAQGTADEPADEATVGMSADGSSSARTAKQT